MSKLALLIGVSEYEPGLNPLPNAVSDVEAVQQVLKNAELGKFDQVKTLINPERVVMESEVENLFSDRTKDDLVLLFFSGHGVKDDSGKLYFATRNTRKNRKGELVRSTAVPSNFVLEVMNNSRSKRQVVILDCCFSGAFAQDMTAKDDGSVDIQNQLGAEGRAVLTSSTSTQYSFEQKGTDLSIYTQYLVEGIETGAADLDNDGSISVDELHDYAKQRVQEVAPAMKPEIYAAREGFRIRLSNAPVSDPKVRYRREVERVTNDGRIFLADRRWLNQLQLQLGLNQIDAFSIEASVQQAYWEYQENLEQYRQAFAEALQNENPLTEQTQRRFRQLQERWKLKPNDVAEIETQVTQQVRLAHKVAQTEATEAPNHPVALVAPVAVEPPKIPTPKEFAKPMRRFPVWSLAIVVLGSGFAGYWVFSTETLRVLFNPSNEPSTSTSTITISPTTPTPTPSESITSERCYLVVNTPKLVIRGGPGTSYPQIGVLREGDKISGVEDPLGWLKVDLFSVKNQLSPDASSTTAWISANYVRSCSAPTDPNPTKTDPDPVPTTKTPPPPLSPPVTPPPPISPTTRCTVCVLYRDHRIGEAKELEQALTNAGIRTKAINTDLTEVKKAERLSPGMVQIIYTEPGATKLNSVMSIVYSLVPENKVFVDPTVRQRLGAGDEIQIRLY